MRINPRTLICQNAEGTWDVWDDGKVFSTWPTPEAAMNDATYVAVRNSR